MVAPAEAVARVEGAHAEAPLQKAVFPAGHGIHPPGRIALQGGQDLGPHGLEVVAGVEQAARAGRDLGV